MPLRAEASTWATSVIITIYHHCCRCQVMLIAPGFVPEGGGIDWGNVTASSLLGLEPGAAVVEGQVCLPSSFVSQGESHVV